MTSQDCWGMAAPLFPEFFVYPWLESRNWLNVGLEWLGHMWKNVQKLYLIYTFLTYIPWLAIAIKWGILANGLVGNFTISWYFIISARENRLLPRIPSCPTRPSGSVLVAPLQMLTANHDLGNQVTSLQNNAALEATRTPFFRWVGREQSKPSHFWISFKVSWFYHTQSGLKRRNRHGVKSCNDKQIETNLRPSRTIHGMLKYAWIRWLHPNRAPKVSSTSPKQSQNGSYEQLLHLKILETPIIRHWLPCGNHGWSIFCTFSLCPAGARPWTPVQVRSRVVAASGEDQNGRPSPGRVTWPGCAPKTRIID